MTRTKLKIKWRKKLGKWNKSYYVNLPSVVVEALSTEEVYLYIDDGKIVLEPISEHTDSDLDL